MSYLRIAHPRILSAPLTPDEALAACAIAKLLLGSDPQPRRHELRSIPTLSYLPHANANKRSRHTDEINLRLHVLPALGRMMLDEITSEHVANLIKDLRHSGYAGGTTNNVLMLLHYIFNLAHKWNHRWSRKSTWGCA